VIVCGGEERGTWLLEQNAASDRTFAFAFSLAAESGGALARVALAADDGAAETLGLPAFFDALVARRRLNLVAVPGLRLTLDWL
jgi:hypothetical protein